MNEKWFIWNFLLITRMVIIDLSFSINEICINLKLSHLTWYEHKVTVIHLIKN